MSFFLLSPLPHAILCLCFHLYCPSLSLSATDQGLLYL